MMKKAVLEIIDYLRYQVVNDKCTAEELRSIYDMASESLKVSATIDDLAEFYGQSKNNSAMYCLADLSLGTKSRREKYITTLRSSGLLYQSLGVNHNF